MTVNQLSLCVSSSITWFSPGNCAGGMPTIPNWPEENRWGYGSVVKCLYCMQSIPGSTSNSKDQVEDGTKELAWDPGTRLLVRGDNIDLTRQVCQFNLIHPPFPTWFVKHIKTPYWHNWHSPNPPISPQSTGKATSLTHDTGGDVHYKPREFGRIRVLGEENSFQGALLFFLR